MGDFFTFDSKIFKSLIPLVIKPGFLTKEFISGKRVRYILPIRLYIFISIVYFFVLSLDNSKEIFPEFGGVNSATSFDVGNDEPIVFTNYDSLQYLVDSLGPEKFAESIGAEEGIIKIIVMQYAKVIEKRGIGLAELIFKNVSVCMFFLLPIFALLLIIFFRKKKHYYLEHLVHSFHLHSFMFLFLCIYILFSLFVKDIFSIWFSIFVISVYMFISYKKVYAYNAWGTLWRGAILSAIYSFVLLIGIVGSVLLSVLVY